jgi:tetratricopeptide (TPR) repeat protein
MRRTGLLLLLVGCVNAWPAAASEESQALSARGLIELNAGRTDQARELFDRAVAADPADPTARYQRGTLRAKLGDDAGAAEDMRAALAARPDFPEAQLELGIALTQLRKYAEAEPYLSWAQRSPELDAQASFFLGIAQLRLDRFAEAQANFVRARTHDPNLDLQARYYEAVIAYRERQYDVAEAGFASIASEKPDSAMGRESARFLDVLARTKPKIYSAFGTLALEYDSNVTLAPSNPVAGSITGQADGRFVIDAGGRYTPLTLGPASLTLSYEFYQSLEFSLTQFNLQDHRPAVQLLFDFDKVLVGVIGRYDYYLLSSSSFLQEAGGYPWVAVREDGIGRTEISARIQWRDYKAHTIDDDCSGPPASCNSPGFTQLDGFYSYAGVRQIIDLGRPNAQLWFGYQLGFMTPDNLGIPQYEYGSNQLEIALRWPLPYAILGETGFRWEHQDYAPESATLSPNGTPRTDNDYRAIIALERPLSEISDHLFVNAAWYGTFNDSNNALFQYDRQIGSIGTEVRF